MTLQAVSPLIPMRKSATQFLSTLSDRFSMTVLFYIRMMKNFTTVPPMTSMFRESRNNWEKWNYTENGMTRILISVIPLSAKPTVKHCCFFYSSTESTTNLNYQIVTYKDVSDVLESNRILFYRAGMLTLVLLLLTGTILFFSLRKIMAPLTKLREAAVSVSEGNYDIQVPAEGDTELAQVGKSFNQMSSKVKEQIECLSTVNHTQRQLMGSLAHELKTPMTSILGYADTLLTVRLQRQQQERALSYTSSECRRLSRLSVKMLELTGLYETGRRTFCPNRKFSEIFSGGFETA